MTTRTTRKTVIFGDPFLLKDVGRSLPPGEYQVITDQELIEGLSFPVYRRVVTMILVPAQSSGASSTEMLTVDPRDLEAALDRDAAAHSASVADCANSVLEQKPTGGSL